MPDSPRSTPVLVGRAVELAALAAAIGLDTGAGGMVLLAGEAGVGKTRPAHRRCGAVPALARWLPGGPPAGTDDPADRQVGDARSEVFEAVQAGLALVSGGAPLLVVVEDVHWADPSTRGLLTFLLTRAPMQAVSIVASYRTDDLHRRHPLRAEALGWSRLSGVTRIHVEPMPDEDVRTLVHELDPGALAADDIDGIVARAEGNAFFTEELVAAARRGQGVLSTDLADLLLLNLDQLEDSARTVLRAVSVAGREVSHALLARVAGPDGPDLDDALRVAIDRNLLVAAVPEGYAFRHALLAEAVYADLLPGERVRWHRRFADALAGGDVEGTDAELARHAHAAHDAPTAIHASIRAGAQALAVGGPDEALRHYERALALLTEPPVGGLGVDPVAVVLAAGESAIAAGQLDRALRLVMDQLAAFPPGGDPVRRALLLHAVASTALLDDAPIDVLQLSTEALQLVPAESDGPLRARLMAVHARANASRRRDEEAIRWATQAADLARALALPHVLADATTTLARLVPFPPPEHAECDLATSVRDARAAADATTELRASLSLGTLLYEAGRLPEAQEVYERAAARAGELRRPWAPYGIDGRVMAAIVCYTRGEWDATLRLADASAQSPPGLARAMLGAVGLQVAAGRGEPDALDRLAGLRSWWERDGFIAILCASAAIDLHGDRGDRAAAVAIHDEVVEVVGALWEHPVFQARVRLGGLLLGHLAGAAAHVGAQERAGLAEHGRVLHQAARDADRAASRHGPEGQAWLARVEAEHLRLRWLSGDPTVDHDDLVRAWTSAVGAFSRFGHVFEVARSQARLGAILRAVGRPVEAERQLDLAGAAARTLGATPLLRELAALGLPASRHFANSRQLTTREHDVLALVAQGRSNREIGHLLHISPKTVSVHVSNILAKLQAGGRTEAVAIARRRGLLSVD